MEKEKLLKELYDLECKIQSTKWNIANNNFYPSNSPSAKEAAKADLKMYEYRYKKMAMDLTKEDRKELELLGAEKGMKLELINKLVFTKAEKEDTKKSQDFFETPFSEMFPDLSDMLDKNEN